MFASVYTPECFLSLDIYPVTTQKMHLIIILLNLFFNNIYVGHPISSATSLISQKLLDIKF